MNLELTNKYKPYENPNEFIDIYYDKILRTILDLETRKEVMEYYIFVNSILKDYRYWGSVDNSRYYIFGNKYELRYEENSFRVRLINNLRNACLNALIKIERFEQYKDYAYRMTKSISEYYSLDSNSIAYSWDFYKTIHPSIHEHVNKYLNLKIVDNAEIFWTDYLFLFKKKSLTKFGWDNFYDVADKFIEILKAKNSSADELLMSYYRKFFRENSKYYFIFQRASKDIEFPQQLFKEEFTERLEIIPISEIYENGEFYVLPCHQRELSKEEEEFINKQLDGDTFYQRVYGVNFSEMKEFQGVINKIFREAENLVREEYNLPKVNEGWISETRLYNEIKKYLNPLVVHQHARLGFLGQQHLDIFIPYLKIAIEYQGKQHFEPVEFFGGQESFLSTLARDERKRKLCEENNIRLIYVEKGYDLSLLLCQLDEIRNAGANSASTN